MPVEAAPDSGEILNMAVQHHQAGRLDQADALYRLLLDVDPDFPDALHLSGLLCLARNQLDEAAELIGRAVAGNPRNAAYRGDLGRAYAALDDKEMALDSFRCALELQPDAPAAHLNLGWALFGSADNSEARKHFETAIKLAPDMSEAHSKLALSYLAGGYVEEAYAYLWRAAQLAVRPQRISARFKLSHDIDQMRHLYARGMAGNDIQQIIGRYESLRDNLPRNMPHDALFTLNEAQHQKLNPSYDGAYYLPACPMLKLSALGKGVQQSQVEKSYFASKPNLAVVDNLLSDEALLRLRAFCREATIWKDVKPGHLGSFLRDGFCEPLLLQIAHELRQSLPAILAKHPLIDMWSYKCDSESGGMGIHADRAAVNVNFWISPDEANRRPESGGLEVFRAEAPLSWNFRRDDNQQDAIDRCLDEQGRDSITIPHRSNRAVIFNSNLFHKSDDCHFRGGYINRRTNITMLFGHRHNG
ncbi:MAG: tetratricopeptide repeat protein [Proteobacteria bacterium]|nr:tetratricopeptide repeat protein [Pseudomonadota bacterium]MDA1356730.1 tetratricopeptide repeat protein [Pseudomonadota bacterium]